MKYHKLNGSIRVGKQEIITTHSTMFHKSGYFYAQAERISISIYPFTPQMVTRGSRVLGEPIIYELGGNNIGNVQWGAHSNADGEWETWTLRSVTITVTCYRNGVNIQFKILSNRGARTFRGSIDPKTEGTVEPLDYEFEVFAKIEDLDTFLVAEHEDWIKPTAFIKNFIRGLQNTNDLFLEAKKTYKTAHVVIGAQFGDEGKGWLTAHLAAKTGSDGIVVRFNGGAQAGHTVLTADGRRHVFSHFGSGTLSGSATYLSRFFVTNPLLFLKEREVLDAKSITPTVYVDPASPVTTPYDMMINQIIEQERGADRHGSCGVGFGETLERHLDPGFALNVADLRDHATLRNQLNRIRHEYVPTRLARLGFASAFATHNDLFRSDAILEHYLEDVERFLDITITADARTAIGDRPLIFEGAQGLRLDQDRGYFPHVTRSHTGLHNVLILADELGLTRLDLYYVTRAYLTRHGAGPLPRELPAKPYPGIVDTTNIPNDYQGALRFADLDLDDLGHAIRTDLSDASAYPALTVNAGLAITCLDQLGGAAIRYYRDGIQHQGSVEDLATAAAETTGLKQILLNFGPSGEPRSNA